ERGRGRREGRDDDAERLQEIAAAEQHGEGGRGDRKLAFVHRRRTRQLELEHRRLYPWGRLSRQVSNGRRRPLLGAHQSIAGGLYRALERGRSAGCEAVQIFTRSSRQWACRPLAEEDVRALAAASAATGIDALVAHESSTLHVQSPGARVGEA